MPIKHEEIIEDLEVHIRKFGGERSEWCVGTAKDARAPFFRRHLAADLGDGLIYREAFTTDAAGQVIDHLVNHRGLRHAALDAQGAQAGVPVSPDDRPVLESGKIVFIYRPTTPDPSLASSGAAVQPATSADRTAFPRRAA
jgi:hypothetical protein